MRLLHAGLHHHGACAAHRGAGLRRRPRARGAVRQHLPLHRLHRHRRGGARRARGLQEVSRHEEHLHRHADGTPRGPALPARPRHYVDDLAIPGLLYAVILRSSVAHGRIVSIDASAALKRARRARGHHRRPTCRAARRSCRCGCSRCREFKPFEQPVIAHDKVRYVGEPIAVVLADSVAIGEDALEAIAVEIEELPAVADWTVAAKNKSLLFEKPGTNRSLVFESRKGDADAAFANAPYVRRERLRTGRHYGLTMEPRGVMAEWDEAQGQAHGLRRGQGAVLQPPHPVGADRPAGRADRDDRERRRRRLWRARRVLSGGFPDPVRGAPRQAPGEMDRGPAREPDGDEPRARGGGDPRGRLRARRHHPRDPRRGAHRHGRLHAHQRRGRRAQRLRSSWPARTACRTSRSTRRSG